jgi:hypothetical protein
LLRKVSNLGIPLVSVLPVEPVPDGASNSNIKCGKLVRTSKRGLANSRRKRAVS